MSIQSERRKIRAENAERRKLYRRVGGIKIVGMRGGITSGESVVRDNNIKRIIAHVYCTKDGHPVRRVCQWLEKNGLRYIAQDDHSGRIEVYGPAERIEFFINPGFAPQWLVNWHYKTDIRYPGAFPARKGPRYSAVDKAKLGNALASPSARSVTRFAPDHLKPDGKTLRNIAVERRAKVKRLEREELARKLSDPSYVVTELRKFVANGFALIEKLGKYKNRQLVVNKAFFAKQEKLMSDMTKASTLLMSYENVPENEVMPTITAQDILSLEYSVNDDVAPEGTREERIFREFIAKHETLSNIRPDGLELPTKTYSYYGYTSFMRTIAEMVRDYEYNNYSTRPEIGDEKHSPVGKYRVSHYS